MNGFRLKILFLLLCLAFLASCTGPDKPGAIGNTTSPPAGENAAASSGSAKGHLFSINGEPVTSSELRAFLEIFFPEEIKTGGKDALAGSTDTFINNRLLAALAEKEGVDRQAAVVSRLETRLSHLWRDVYWSQIVKPAIRIEERDLLREAPKFNDMISLQQLVVPSREEAGRLRERAVGGEDFGEIIRTNSTGLTARSGGMVGFVKEDSTMYDPALLKALFGMKTGDYSPVEEMPIGFTVIRVLEKKTADQARGEWVAANRERLIQGLEKREWERALDGLVRKHKIVENRKVIEEFLLAREGKKSLEPLMGKTLVTIDGIPLTVADVTDPSGLGVIHGNQAIEQILRKRVEDFAIAREVAKRNLKEKFPEIARKETLLRENLLARAYIDHRCRDLKVTREERKRYYDENKGRFVREKALDVALIETRSPARVEKIYEELRGGAPFEEVADRWSDKKEMKGGRLGFVEVEKIAPEFSAVKGLRAGEYAKVPIRLRSREGEDLYVIPKVAAVREKRTVPFGEIDKPVLDKAIIARKREAAIGRLMEELKQANTVTFTPEYDIFAATLEQHTNRQGEKK